MLYLKILTPIIQFIISIIQLLPDKKESVKSGKSQKEKSKVVMGGMALMAIISIIIICDGESKQEKYIERIDSLEDSLKITLDTITTNQKMYAAKIDSLKDSLNAAHETLLLNQNKWEFKRLDDNLRKRISDLLNEKNEANLNVLSGIKSVRIINVNSNNNKKQLINDFKDVLLDAGIKKVIVSNSDILGMTNHHPIEYTFDVQSQNYVYRFYEIINSNYLESNGFYAEADNTLSNMSIVIAIYGEPEFRADGTVILK